MNSGHVDSVASRQVDLHRSRPAWRKRHRWWQAPWPQSEAGCIDCHVERRPTQEHRLVFASVPVNATRCPSAASGGRCTAALREMQGALIVAQARVHTITHHLLCLIHAPKHGAGASAATRAVPRPCAVLTTADKLAAFRKASSGRTSRQLQHGGLRCGPPQPYSRASTPKISSLADGSVAAACGLRDRRPRSGHAFRRCASRSVNFAWRNPYLVARPHPGNLMCCDCLKCRDQAG